MTVDYRELNKRTIDAYSIDDTLDALSSSKLCLDLKSGYYQFSMNEEHVE